MQPNPICVLLGMLMHHCYSSKRLESQKTLGGAVKIQCCASSAGRETSMDREKTNCQNHAFIMSSMSPCLHYRRLCPCPHFHKVYVMATEYRWVALQSAHELVTCNGKQRIWIKEDGGRAVPQSDATPLQFYQTS